MSLQQSVGTINGVGIQHGGSISFGSGWNVPAGPASPCRQDAPSTSDMMNLLVLVAKDKEYNPIMKKINEYYAPPCQRVRFSESQGFEVFQRKSNDNLCIYFVCADTMGPSILLYFSDILEKFKITHFTMVGTCGGTSENLSKVFFFTRTMMLNERGEVKTYSCDTDQHIMGIWREQREQDICVRPKNTDGNDGKEKCSTLFTASVGETLSQQDLNTTLTKYTEADAVDMEAALLWKMVEEYNLPRDNKIVKLPIIKAVSDTGHRKERDQEPGDQAKVNVATITKLYLNSIEKTFSNPQ